MSSNILDEGNPLVGMEVVKIKREVCDTEASNAVVCMDHDYYQSYCDPDRSSSMVSLFSKNSEGMCKNEFIVPDSLDEEKKVGIVKTEIVTELKQTPNVWPTLEILPGGIIKNPDNNSNNLQCFNIDNNNSGKLHRYECAICSYGFESLFVLVKHVKIHTVTAMKIDHLNIKSRKKNARSDRANKRRTVVSRVKKGQLPKKIKS